MKSIFCHKAKAVPPAANTLRFEFSDQSYSPVTGAAELAQIPTSWGGTKEEA